MSTAVSSLKSYTSTKPALAVRDLAVRYDRRSPNAFGPASFTIEPDETLAVVGPSGAGKSTLLRALAGLVQSSGTITLGGREIEALPAQQRRIALVFQHDSLVPSMTVRGNVEFVAPHAGAHRRRSVESLAGELGFADLLDRAPSQLSGGERQRVAIARAMVSQPLALLLDEPFAHLDPPLRTGMRSWMVRVRSRIPGPVVYVTHDHSDALAAGSRLAVLIGGLIRDIGDPQRVYERPAHVDVARFLGDRPMNVLDAPGVFFDDDALVGIRAERVLLDADGALPGRVCEREVTGADAYLRVETAHGDVHVRTAAGADVPPQPRLTLPREALCRYDRHTGVALD